MWTDAYAPKYQKTNGFKIKVRISEIEELDGFLSLQPSTRSTYDIAMRDATIDGLITMDDIQELKPGRTFYKINNPNEIYILQSANTFEMQPNTKNINAIKQNCFVDIQRKDDEDDIFKNIYSELIAFVTMQNKDEKNFNAGTEDNTFLSIQIPKRDYNNKVYEILNEDRLIVKQEGLERKVKVESVNLFAMPGVITIAGTFDTRS